MPDQRRFAIQYVPANGRLADFGAAWFGYDCRTGATLHEARLEGLTPRPFTRGAALLGFQAPLKPPFTLAEGMSFAALNRALADFAASAAPMLTGPLQLDRLDRRVVLAAPDSRALSDLAADLVIRFDHYRAEVPADTGGARLSARQQSLLARWGDPRVLEEFRFRFALTDEVDAAKAEEVLTAFGPRMGPLLGPLTVDEIALAGERPDGRFQVLGRYPLGGTVPHIRASAHATELPAGSRM